MKIKFYILRSKWNPFRKRGIILNITPSFKCNFNCWYCAVNTKKGIKVADKGYKTALEWFNYIDTFPVKIAVVEISGGEPTLYKEFVELVIGLLKRGLFVYIYTNLSNPDVLMKLPKTNHLLLNPTYHKGQINPTVFLENYNMLKSKQRMYIDEIGNLKYFSFTRLKALVTENEKKSRKGLRVKPDGSIYTDCYSLVHL